MEADDPGAGMPQREFIELAKGLLLDRGRPMQSHALLSAFHDIGRRVGGKDELRNLTTKLWRASDEIVKVPGAGYWVRSVPCAAVRYLPPRQERDREIVDPTQGTAESTQPGLDQQAQVSEIKISMPWNPMAGGDIDDEVPF